MRIRLEPARFGYIYSKILIMKTYRIYLLIFATVVLSAFLFPKIAGSFNSKTISAIASNSGTAEYMIMRYVETNIAMKSQGNVLLLTEANGHTEEIAGPEMAFKMNLTKENISKVNAFIADNLTRLANKGWHLEGIIGGTEYLLKKN
jgi:hypothetical protein